MAKMINIQGQKFNRLEVLHRVDNDSVGNAVWKCLCDCGTETFVTGVKLRQGGTSSCGCLARELSSKRARTHGMEGSREYHCWSAMKQRCYNPKDKRFKNYGGRGIKVCKRWRDSFEAFFEDMGPCPKGLTLERINNNLGYFPDNCKWATPKEQAGNRRSNVYLAAFGTTMIKKDWARKIGVSRNGLEYHLKQGRSLEQIICHFKKASSW